MNNQKETLEGALITPTYAPDFKRCKMLCDSVERYVTNITRHVLIVDESDVPLFSELETGRTEIMTKESMIEWDCVKLPVMEKWWFSPKAVPIRGWIFQQIIKLACAEVLDEDYFIYVDSDVTFIRPFDTGSLVRNGAVKLYGTKRLDYEEHRHNNWYRFANKALGLKDGPHMGLDYIGSVCCMRRDVLKRLYKHLEMKYQKYWKKVLWNTLDFSEYILYGSFADAIVGDDALHFRSDEQLAYCRWSHDIKNDDDLCRFLHHVPPEYFAVHVQSNLNIDPAQIAF